MGFDTPPSAQDPLHDRPEAIARSLLLLRELRVGPEQNEEMRILLNGTREEAEAATFEGIQAKLFGTLPHFEERDNIVSHLADELSCFSNSIHLESFPDWKRKLHVEGLVLYEMKFGERLSKFADEILAQYPPIATEPGKKISIFGLSGSGKSTAVDALREVIDPVRTIVMDNDTVRYNLFAKKLKDADGAAGVSTEELQQRIHNRISGAMYLLLEYVTTELRSRGYTIILSSAFPAEGSDTVLYVQHREADPKEALVQGGSGFDEHVVWAMAESLKLVTDRRVQGHDNYDWEHAETVRDFRSMKDVTAKVPAKAHEQFIRRTATYLMEHPDVLTIRNEQIEDPDQRKQHLKDQCIRLLAVGRT